MSVCDPVTGMHHLFKQSLPLHFFADAPQIPFGGTWNDRDIDSLRQILERHGDRLAAVILEPIVQGAGGMRFYTSQYLQKTRELCDRHNVLLIFDEIATGFGRTGSLFACDLAQVTPDLLCLGKALTGGYLGLAAVLASDRLAEGLAHSEAKVFMHGPTFMGNPLACAIACASIDLLLESNFPHNVQAIEQQLQSELCPAQDHPHVKDVRVLGAIGVIETYSPIAIAEAQRFFVEQCVWIRPFGRLLYIMPPYIVQPQELSQLCQAMIASLDRPIFSG
jgi:adenosylmethionine-8-amino-7-oxononanoate aminotransferase